MSRVALAAFCLFIVSLARAQTGYDTDISGTTVVAEDMMQALSKLMAASR